MLSRSLTSKQRVAALISQSRPTPIVDFFCSAVPIPVKTARRVLITSDAVKTAHRRSLTLNCGSTLPGDAVVKMSIPRMGRYSSALQEVLTEAHNDMSQVVAILRKRPDSEAGRLVHALIDHAEQFLEDLPLDLQLLINFAVEKGFNLGSREEIPLVKQAIKNSRPRVKDWNAAIPKIYLNWPDARDDEMMRLFLQPTPMPLRHESALRRLHESTSLERRLHESTAHESTAPPVNRPPMNRSAMNRPCRHVVVTCPWHLEPSSHSTKCQRT